MELNGLNIADVLYGFSIMLKATFAKFYDGFIEDETTKRLDDRMLFCLMYWFVFFVFFSKLLLKSFLLFVIYIFFILFFISIYVFYFNILCRKLQYFFAKKRKGKFPFSKLFLF